MRFTEEGSYFSADSIQILTRNMLHHDGVLETNEAFWR
jgi:hypothetical protein